MKRQYSGRTGALVASSQGEQGFWPSYADMMSSFALILFFLMLLSYIQNLITGNDLQNTQEVLADTRAQLSITVNQVEEAEEQLSKITIDLSEAETLLGEQQKLLAEQELLISDQKALVEDQAKYLASANREIEEMRAQMQTIAVLRLSILEQIKDSIENVMGSSGSVSISDNGSIILSESVLFDYSSYEIKEECKPILEKLVQVFSRFLADSNNAKYVDSIVISGHTDSTGSAETNRQLSTERANSVLNYMYLCNNGQLNRYSQYFCAAGYGANRPVGDNNTEAGRAANRRIEISIILKDDTVLDIVESYLAIDPPRAP